MNGRGGRGAPGDPGDPRIERPDLGGPVIGPRPIPIPRPIPWTPFGPGDTGTPDVVRIAEDARRVRAALEKARLDLTARRHGRGPDNTPPVVRELARSEGLWPWLLIRHAPGDLGERPLPAATINLIRLRKHHSPDISFTPAGAMGARTEIGRSDTATFLAARTGAIFTNHAYDLWAHVWNLGLGRATGVRIRAYLGIGGRFVGGREIDLAARDQPGCHRLVRVATFTPAFPPDDAFPLVTVVAESITDPANGTVEPGEDRHVAHVGPYISPG